MKYLLLLALIFLPTVSHAAVLNFTGVELNSILEYSLRNGTISIDSGTVYSGTYSLRVNPSTTAIGYIEPDQPSTDGAGDNSNIYNLSSIYTTFWFRVATLPSSGSEFIVEALNTSNIYKGGIHIDSTGKLLVMDSTSASTAIATGATTLSTDTWYRIDFNINTGTSASYEIKINGVSELSGTGDFTTANTRRMRYGKTQDVNSQSVDFFYDNIIIDDAAFADTNVQMRIDVPTGNGTYTAWTAGTNASDYQEVDEIPQDGNTTIIQSTAASDRSSFTFPSTASSGITGTVLGVKINNWSAEVTAGTSELVAFTKSGATVTDGAAQDTITNYNVLRVIYMTTDPNTGSAWTLSGVDGLEGGIMEGATSPVRMKMTAMYRQVLYIPDAGGGGGGTSSEVQDIFWFD